MPAALSGRFVLTVRRPDGSVGGRVVIRNRVFMPALNYLLAAGFRLGATLANTGVGLIAADGFTGTSADDTAASHPGWSMLFPEQPVRRVITGGANDGRMRFGSPNPNPFSCRADVGIRGACLFHGLTGTSGGPVSVNTNSLLVAAAVYYGPVTADWPAPYGQPLFLPTAEMGGQPSKIGEGPPVVNGVPTPIYGPPLQGQVTVEYSLRGIRVS